MNLVSWSVKQLCIGGINSKGVLRFCSFELGGRSGFIIQFMSSMMNKACEAPSISLQPQAFVLAVQTEENI